jgi:hypothetical protein
MKRLIGLILIALSLAACSLESEGGGKDTNTPAVETETDDTGEEDQLPDDVDKEYEEE